MIALTRRDAETKGGKPHTAAKEGSEMTIFRHETLVDYTELECTLF